MEIVKYKTSYQKCPSCGYEYQGEIEEKIFKVKEKPIIGDENFIWIGSNDFGLIFNVNYKEAQLCACPKCKTIKML